MQIWSQIKYFAISRKLANRALFPKDRSIIKFGKCMQFVFFIFHFDSERWDKLMYLITIWIRKDEKGCFSKIVCILVLGSFVVVFYSAGNAKCVTQSSSPCLDGIVFTVDIKAEHSTFYISPSLIFCISRQGHMSFMVEFVSFIVVKVQCCATHWNWKIGRLVTVAALAFDAIENQIFGAKRDCGEILLFVFAPWVGYYFVLFVLCFCLLWSKQTNCALQFVCPPLVG